MSCVPGAAGWPCWFKGHGRNCEPRAAGEPCWFPGHGKSCFRRAAASHVGSQGMAGAVAPRVLLAMLIPGA